jgi:hypothetical protein
MVTRERQLYIGLVEINANALELTAQLVGRLAIDLPCDRRHRTVVRRHVSGVQASVGSIRMRDLLIEPIG